MAQDWKAIIPRVEQLLDKVEGLLTASTAAIENPVEPLDGHIAFRWRSQRLIPVKHPDLMGDLADLIGVDRQIKELDRNTRQFLRGLPANHALLWGDRGTGKSSLIKGILHRYASEGLRLIEVNKEGLLHLQEIADLLWERPERYLLFCDDLSFSEGEAEYRELKAMLEGGIAARPGERPDLRDLQPSSPDAAPSRGKPISPNRRRRVISARDHRREGVTQRQVWTATRLLSVLSTHLPTDCLPLRPKAWVISLFIGEH